MLPSKQEQCPQPSWNLWGDIRLPPSHFHRHWGAVWGWMHLHLSPVSLVILFHWNKSRSIWKDHLICMHLILIYQAGQGGDEARYWKADSTAVFVLTYLLRSARHGLIKQSWLCMAGWGKGVLCRNSCPYRQGRSAQAGKRKKFQPPLKPKLHQLI